MAHGFEITLTPQQRPRISFLESTIAATDFVQVAHSVDDRHVLVMLGEIHYRRDLLQRFPISSWADKSDADLLLRIIRRHGTEALAGLEGDYSIALVDRVRESVILSRDPLGRWPLYYRLRGGIVYVGTRLRRVASHHGDELDPEYMAGFLGRHFPCVELPTNRTAFTHCHRVLPGECVLISTRGESQVIHTGRECFQPDEDAAEMDIETAGIRYRQLLTEAIAQRMGHGGIAAHMSGGMDSSTVACLASSLLDQHQDERPIHTLSLVYQMRGQAGERDYMQMVTEGNSRFRTNYLAGDNALDFDGFRDGIPGHDEPYSGMFRGAMERLLIDAAQERGVRTILTGGAAELTVEPRKHHLADHFRRGRWGELWREARRYASGAKIGMRQLFSRYAIEPNVPASLRIGSGIARGVHGKWPNLGAHCIAPWIQPQFANQHHMRNKMVDALARVRYPFEQSAWEFERTLMAGDWAKWNLAVHRGIRICHPFLDPRLVRFVRSLPRTAYDVPGQSKPLLQSATRDVLPEPVRTRRYKCTFNEVYWEGLRRNVPRIEEMLRKSSANDMRIFDMPQLLSAVREHALGKGNVVAGSHINRSLAVVAWIDSLTVPAVEQEHFIDMNAQSEPGLNRSSREGGRQFTLTP